VGEFYCFCEHQLIKDSVPTVVLLPRKKDVWRNGRIAPRTNNSGTTGYWLGRMLEQHKKSLCSWQEPKSVLAAHDVEPLGQQFRTFPRNVLS